MPAPVASVSNPTPQALYPGAFPMPSQTTPTINATPPEAAQSIDAVSSPNAVNTAPIPPIKPAPPRSAEIIALEGIKTRWLPKQIFNKNAPPEDRVANPLKVSLVAGACSLMPGIICFILPLMLGAYIFQRERNNTALQEIRDNKQQESANALSQNVSFLR